MAYKNRPDLFLDSEDALLELKNSPKSSLVEFGLDDALRIIERATNVHNAFVNLFVAKNFVKTDDQMRRYGSSPRLRMVRGEDGDGLSPNCSYGGYEINVGFPLDRSHALLDWTEEAWATKPPSYFAEILEDLFEADWRKIYAEMVKALNAPAFTEHKDVLYNYLVLPVRGLLRADGNPIPTSMSGTVFDSNTHTHYHKIEKVDADSVRDLLMDVVEHPTVGDLRIYINKELIQSFFDMQGNCFPYLENEIKNSPSSAELKTYLDRAALEDVPLIPSAYNTYAIGRFDAAEVVVAPWVPKGSLFAVDTGIEDVRTLVWRTRPGGTNSDLRLRTAHEGKPLLVEVSTRDFGIGVWMRHMTSVGEYEPLEETN